MNTLKRRKDILDQLEREGMVKTIELSERLNVSSMTIRRDLNYLAGEGMVTLTHGGATMNSGALMEHHIFFKQETLIEEKRRIGEFCYNFVNEGEAIFIDTGSTTQMIAETLVNRKNIVVVSHSMPVQQILSRAQGIKMIAAPGVFREKTMGFLGQMTCDFVSRLKYDILFLGVEGVDVKHGVSVPDIVDGETKRALVQQAKKVIAVADYTKIGISYFMTIVPLKEIDVLVTNKEADSKIIEQIREQGIEVFLV